MCYHVSGENVWRLHVSFTVGYLFIHRTLRTQYILRSRVNIIIRITHFVCYVHRFVGVKKIDFAPDEKTINLRLQTRYEVGRFLLFFMISIRNDLRFEMFSRKLLAAKSNYRIIIYDHNILIAIFL